MKKASLHVQQYTAITAHSSGWEIRVSLLPPRSLHNEGLNPRPQTCEGKSLKHTPSLFGWCFFFFFLCVCLGVGGLFFFFFFFFFFVTGSHSVRQATPEALNLPISCLSLLCTWEHKPALSGPTFQLVSNHGLIKASVKDPTAQT